MRNLLRMAIDWESLGIIQLLEACDGAEAQKIIRGEKPEIIITDMRMPNVDGVSLLQEISQLSYPRRVIVVSGYDDYKYMRKTIEYGGFDYFIKPIDEEELQERLKMAIAEIGGEVAKDMQRREAAIRLNEQKMTIRNEKLSQWMGNPDGFAQVRDWFRDELQWTEGQAYALAQIRVIERTDRIKRLFGKRMDLLYFSVVNIANEIMGFPTGGVAFRDLSAGGSVLLFIRAIDTSDAESLCAEISKAINRTYRFSAEILIGPVQRFPQGAGQAKALLQDIALHKNMMSPTGDRVYTKQHLVSCGTVSLLDEEKELKRILAATHRQAISNVIRRILEQCKKAGGIQLRQITWWEQELSWLKSHFMTEVEESAGESSLNMPVELSYWDERGDFSIARLEKSLHDHLMMIADQVDLMRRRKQNIDLHQIWEYIKSSYHKTILIQDLADKFYMNPEYLARQFKQEFNISIKEFVTELRIEQAKRLLVNRHLRIHEISSMVGYSDEKYFSKVFKKETSYTPQQYRQSIAGYEVGQGEEP